MTITNYTFFSPTGTEFPVSSNADAKLYLMLSGMTLLDYKRTDWTDPVDTALNRQYTNTSIVAAGRYFELTDETVVLGPSSTNYVHANIDLANATNPVALSVESTDNSNGNDINTSSGVFKKCIDIIQTDTSTVLDSIKPKENIKIDGIDSGDILASKISSKNDTPLATISASGAPSAKIYYMRTNGIVYITAQGNWGNWGTANVNIVKGNIPVGFRPPREWQAGMSSQGGQEFMTAFVSPNGDISINSAKTGTKYGSFSMSYPAVI